LVNFFFSAKQGRTQKHMEPENVGLDKTFRNSLTFSFNYIVILSITTYVDLRTLLAKASSNSTLER